MDCFGRGKQVGNGSVDQIWHVKAGKSRCGEQLRNGSFVVETQLGTHVLTVLGLRKQVRNGFANLGLNVEGIRGIELLIEAWCRRQLRTAFDNLNVV